jgi:DNA-binding transcriptional regulator LsrR (DeoR family)
VALAKGDRKLPGIRAALSRRLVNGILTDEYTATKLLENR